MNRKLELCLWLALVVTLLWGVGMTIEAAGFESRAGITPVSCTYFSGKPVVDLELARSSACFQDIILQGDRQKNIGILRTNTHMDFGFIALYWAVFVLFAGLDRDVWSKWVALSISVAAAFDCLENFRILGALRQMQRSFTLPTGLPLPFSLAKWIAFSAALFALGMLIRSVWLRPDPPPNSWVAGVLSAVLLTTAPLTLVGLFVSKFMLAAGLFFLLAMAIAVVHYFPFHLSVERILSFVKYAYLTRFQLVAAVLLAIVLPLGYRAAPSIFVGLFDAGGFVSFILVVWIALQLAWTVMVAYRLVLVYGPERFTGLQQVPLCPVSVGTISLFGLLAVPCIAVLWMGSQDLGWIQKASGIALGIGLAITTMFITALLHYSIEEQSGKTATFLFPSFGFLQPTMRDADRSCFQRAADSRISRLPVDLTRGLLRENHLRSGHRLATTVLFVLFLFYVGIGVIYSPARFSPERQPAALFYLLFLITLFTWLMSGAAFVLDRVRLPVFTTLLILSLATGLIRTDHQFRITHNLNQTTIGISPPEVIEHWAHGSRGAEAKTATIIATAGGGIRASAWTAEVVTQLQHSCGEKFSSSLVLVSSVSGGSVGSMFVVAPFDSATGIFPRDPASLEAIRFDASRSSLSAVGWGLLYIDVARTAPFLGAIVPQTVDRGWALENAWVTGWKEPPNLSDWRRDVAAGTRPAVIFNGTAAENGEQFVFASTDMKTNGVIRFSDNFRDWDIPIATAARLSATFPYVSPIARPSEGPNQYRYHVGDGGYYDNSGVVSALEWVREAEPALRDYKILLILIDAESGSPQDPSSWSWQRQITGPVETLLNVRTSSQQLRDKFELELALDILKKDGMDVHAASFQYPITSPAPLSWHLNHEQITAIHDAWDSPGNEQAKTTTVKLLGCGN